MIVKHQRDENTSALYRFLETAKVQAVKRWKWFHNAAVWELKVNIV